eukprot:1160827-Pelagomonas_calceolata.AAC.19
MATVHMGHYYEKWGLAGAALLDLRLWKGNARFAQTLTDGEPKVCSCTGSLSLHRYQSCMMYKVWFVYYVTQLRSTVLARAVSCSGAGAIWKRQEGSSSTLMLERKDTGDSRPD